MPFLGPDHIEQLASFNESQKARHGLITAHLISVGWNAESASFLAVERVMEEDARGLVEASKSTTRPLTDTPTIVDESTVVPISSMEPASP